METLVDLSVLKLVKLILKTMQLKYSTFIGKHITLFLFCCFFLMQTGYAKDDSENKNTSSESFSIYQENPTVNAFTSGLGITVFDDEVYYNVYLAPELVFGKVGVGLDVNLRIDTDGELRDEDWDDGASSFLRLIRYVRYGQKYDSVYARLGQLENTKLGHGSIVYLYRNNGSYDTRKLGLEFDLDFGQYGFESMINDISGFHILAVRPYARPLLKTQLPLLKNLEVGFTWVRDFRDNTNLVATPASLGLIEENGQIAFNPALATRENGLTVWGFDLGLPILKTRFLDILTYVDFVKIQDFGSGGLLGVSANVKNLSQLFTLSAKLEHRVLGDQFQFSYFDALYEQDRFQTVVSGQNDFVLTRANELANHTSPGPGIYGDLGASVLNVVKVFGSYQRLYKTERGGLLHLSAGLKELIPKVMFKADYYKRDITAESDLFKLDDRSLSIIEFGYYPQPYMLLSIVYQWTYLPLRDSNDDIIGYSPIRRVEPRVAINFQF